LFDNVINCRKCPHRARKYHINVLTKATLQKCDGILFLGGSLKNITVHIFLRQFLTTKVE